MRAHDSHQVVWMERRAVPADWGWANRAVLAGFVGTALAGITVLAAYAVSAALALLGVGDAARAPGATILVGTAGGATLGGFLGSFLGLSRSS
ncbi:MAG TPA: hypothetical protein VG370_13160, partial [Chloroflexota bacterium]|jgi:hypothetical protein|nr:hypothetical protein [Chloroflexota bacterium]